MQNSWQPTAPLVNLKIRAQLLTKIRQFFAAREILEVETPLLCHSSITDPNIHSITANYSPIGKKISETLYLQTSPEFAMKRLLAAGSGSIYQICKAFRNGEYGSHHNPEFTMLEWYHSGFDHHQLMNEMDQLLSSILVSKPAEKISYQEVFLKHLQVDVFNCTKDQLRKCGFEHGLTINDDLTGDEWLNLLLAELIEPHLGKGQPTFLYDFPASQAALARLNPKDQRIAHRFEVYIDGIELANGFYELGDAVEQRQRFERDLVNRTKLNLPQIPLDEYFLAALAHGFPDCAGVALGIDRLLMVITKAQCLKEVLAFPLENA